MKRQPRNKLAFTQLAAVLSASCLIVSAAQASGSAEYQIAADTLAEQLAEAANVAERYAVPVNVPAAEVLPRGSWQVSGNQATWSWSVSADGAQNISVGYATADIPPAAELWLHGGGVTQGPYGADFASRSEVLTAIVPGENATLIATMPVSQRSDFDFADGITVFYGFRNFRGVGPAASARADEPQKKAGACLDSNDVVCPVGDAWQNEIRAVARITVGNVLLCSATLLNDTAQSLRPFLLTADHCGEDVGSDDGGYDAVDALNTTVYWNFERSRCGGSNDGDLTQNQLGAQLRANNKPIDFALLELRQRPQSAFNVHWAGWDATGTGGRSGAGIHHPAGDEKKISLFNRSLIKQRPTSTLRREDYWRVEWSDGVTEGGSSGSGLWNQDRRLVGSLSRGLSACRTATNGFNGNPEDEPDFYSAFDAAWVGNGRDDGRLSTWLDADNRGLLAVNGRDESGEADPVGGDSGGGTDNGSGSGSGSASGGGGGGGAIVWLGMLLALLRVQRLGLT